MVSYLSYPRRRQLLAIAGLVLATVLFGGYFVAGRHGTIAGFRSSDLVALRYVVPAILFAPFLFRHGVRSLGGVGWARGAALTIVGGAPYSFLVMLGVQFAPAVHATVITPGLTPIATAVFALAFLGERPTLGAVLGIPLALAGVVLVAGPGLWVVGHATWLGDLMFAAGALSYALFTVLLRRWQVPPLSATASVNILSAALWLPPYAAFRELGELATLPLAEVIAQAVFQGLLTSVLAAVLYVHAVQVLGASRTAIAFVLVPVFGVLLATALLDEPLTALQAGGIAIVGLGMILATRPRS